LLKISVSSKVWYYVKLWNKNHLAYIQRVCIKPDLNPQEQQENKTLRSQILEQNKSGKHYKTKKGGEDCAEGQIVIPTH